MQGILKTRLKSKSDNKYLETNSKLIQFCSSISAEWWYDYKNDDENNNNI